MSGITRWATRAIAVAAGLYAAYVVVAWRRYGRAIPPTQEEHDPLLDRFMPAYDIVERHHIRVEAPADVTLLAACEADLQASPIVAAIIRAREVMLGAVPDSRQRPRGLVAEVQSLGWGVLTEIPGREIVIGAVTKPWDANVTFRAVPPETFADFDEPGLVKIAWTLRADPIDENRSIFRTETRAVATDVTARTRFRRYWSLLSPGIIAIRWALLRPVKTEAERRASAEASFLAYDVNDRAEAKDRGTR
jgi:hypothetical protein